MPPVDPNEVLMTGENSFIRLSPDGGTTLSDRASHWRVLWCPAGAGHTLFLQSTLTGRPRPCLQRQHRVARWLQKTIDSLLFPAFADTALPVLGARFERQGGPWFHGDGDGDGRPTRGSRSRGTTASSPSLLNAPPGFNNRPIGVFSNLLSGPERAARTQRRVATGGVWPEMRGDRQGRQRLPRLVGDLVEAARIATSSA